MTFANTDYLYLLALVPALVLFGLWVSYRNRAAVSRLGDPDLIARLSAAVSRRSRAARNTLWLVALVLAAIAFARPQWGSDIQVLEKQGRTGRRHPRRVQEHARRGRPRRTGSIVPSWRSPACWTSWTATRSGWCSSRARRSSSPPLTFDYTAAKTYLDEAGPGLISRPGTAIDKAIFTSLSAFDYKRPGQKVIILMTDGENLEGNPFDAVAEAAERTGVVIYTVGFGSAAGEPLPEYDQWGRQTGMKRDADGNLVLSKLDEPTLRQIARTGGGRYYRASAPGAMEDLAEELDSLQKETVEAEFETLHIERFQIFLALAVLLLIAIEVLPDRVVVLPWRRRAAKEAA